MLKAMLVLAFLGMMLLSEQLNRKYETEGVRPPVVALLVLTWSNQLDVDIDLHLKCPTGEAINYVRKEACWATLERDAQASASDWTMINNQRVVRINNREVVSLRVPVEGEWTANVHWYGGNSREPVEATLEILSIEPRVETLFSQTVVLERPSQELHITRFSMSAGGVIGVFDSSRPVMLVKPSLNNSLPPPPASPR